MTDAKGRFLNDFNGLADITEDWLRREVKGDLSGNFLWDACQYSLLGSGKRFRSVLALASAQMLGVERDEVRAFALALEDIHTSSLIRDDLPMRDDDALRRGQASCHIVYGAAKALLAGDFLVPAAFRLVLRDSQLEPEVRLLISTLLSEAVLELCEGQALDVAATMNEYRAGEDIPESRFIGGPERKDILSERHQKKTAALISAAVCGPAIICTGSKSSKEFRNLMEFGRQLGLLYQITDDIIDETSTTEVLGKVVGSDKRQGTSTYVSMYGLAGASCLADDTAKLAINLLSMFEEKAGFLRNICHFVLDRKK